MTSLNRFAVVMFAALVAACAPAVAAQPPADPLRQHFEAAQTFQLTGELDRADAEYTREVIPRALERLASIASAEGLPSEATSLLEQAIAASADYLDARIELAALLVRQRSFDRARVLVDEVLSRDKSQPRALGVQGKLDLIAGHLKPAIVELRQAVGAQPDRDFAFALAIALIRDKQPDAARVIFDEMVAGGATPELYLRIGRAYLECGEYDEAIAQFKAAVERGPQFARAHHYLGVAYLLAGGVERASQARAELTLASQMNPDLPRTKAYLSSLDRSQLPDLVEPHESVLFDQPRAADLARLTAAKAQLIGVLATAYYNRGVIRSRQQLFAAAADDIRLAARWKPDMEGLERAWGVASYFAGNYEDAVDHLTRHLAAHVDDSEARGMLDQSAAKLGATIPAPAASPEEPATPALPATAAFDEIDQRIEQGKLDEAERAIWPIVQSRPDSAPAAARLGIVRHRQRRTPEAQSLLERALGLDPGLVPASRELAAIYREAGQQEKARQTLADGLTASPGNALIICDLARMDLDDGHPDRAIDRLRNIPEATRPPEAMVVLIGASLALDRPDEVRELVEAAGPIVDAKAAAEIARILLDHQHVDEALALTESVSGRVAATADLLAARARAHDMKGDARRAEQEYEQALSLNPDSVAALCGLAALADRQGNPARAVDLLTRARSASNDAPDVLVDLVQVSMRAVRLDEALSAARKLVSLRPDDAEAAYLLGIAELQAEDWPAAQATFANLVARDPNGPLGHLGLGIARFGRRDYSAAQTEFERTLSLDPRQTEASYHLGLIAREQGRTSDAMARFENTLAVRQDHVPALTALGALLIQEGNLERAQRVLERATTADPRAAEPHYQLGILFTRLKEPARARREMERFLELRHAWRSANPGTPLRSGFLERLAPPSAPRLARPVTYFADW